MATKSGMSKTQKILAFLSLTLAAGVCFKVPYLKTVFYDSMMKSMNVNNTQLGALTGTYSIFKAIIYIPCGIIVDKFNNRIMLTLSMLLLAILTFWYGFLPSYGALQVIHVLFAISNAIFWVSFIKGIRLIGKAEEQGSMFGFSEGIRALAGAGVTFLGVWVLSLIAEKSTGMSWVLFLYAAFYLVLTIGIWVYVPNDSEDVTSRVSLKDYLNVLKVPGVWLVALLVGLAYSAQIISEYTTPYLTRVYGMTAVTAGVVATIRSYLTGVVSAPIFGKIADKTNSPARMVTILLFVEVLMAFVFYAIPGTPEFLIFAVSMVIVFSVFMYGVRGIYYSTMGEAMVPVSMTGTAAGIISVIGYLPDTFLHTLMGSILDKHPGETGFKIGFLMMAAFAVAGLVVSLIIFYKGKRVKSQTAALQPQSA
ncbi:MAG: MFS transporter [Deltaproteobacteria bacterium]|nr:MFS transporter [Deltaproteobacteria bacterium]